MKCQPVMCATCPFREGSPYAHLVDYLRERAYVEGRTCHSTGNNAINDETGKPEMFCRGVRDLQIELFAAIGFIDAPTDEAWDRKWQEMQAKK